MKTVIIALCTSHDQYVLSSFKNAFWNEVRRAAPMVSVFFKLRVDNDNTVHFFGFFLINAQIFYLIDLDTKLGDQKMSVLLQTGGERGPNVDSLSRSCSCNAAGMRQDVIK